jgi:hypothetical protein
VLVRMTMASMSSWVGPGAGWNLKPLPSQSGA